MALIRCPEHQHDVSDKAHTCPGCGHPLWHEGWRRGAASVYSYEYRSKKTVFGMPLVHIVCGPVWLIGLRPARGFIAIGNAGIDVVASGGFALGLLSLAGIGLGFACLAGIALGIGVGIGGIATGYLAVGGLAIGVYAIGSMGIGTHALQNDPLILESLRRLFSK